MRERIAFFLLLISSLHADVLHYDYGSSGEVKGLVPSEIYRQAVDQLPICCVDVLLVNRDTQSYLLIKRDNPPAKGVEWYPGGRLYKGESFFQCATRKVLEETNLHITPLEVLGVYSTVFPDSAWGCSTHTINIAVFAEYVSGDPSVDALHADYTWKPLDVPPGDGGYLDEIFYSVKTRFSHE